MCKHVVMVPMKPADSALQKKTCTRALLSRVWLAGRRSLKLDHSPAYHFACCQWQLGHRPTTSYLVYRWFLFLAVLSIGIASFVCQKIPQEYESQIKLNYFKWFIYFTNWGFMLIAVEAGLALVVVYRHRASKGFNLTCEEEETLALRRRTPLLCRAYWLFHIIATDLAFVITVVYWTLVHNPKIHELNALNLLVHGGNSLAMLCELAVTSHPVRAAHALYSVGAGVAYGLFSAAYWASGGTDRLGFSAIYPALDWNKPGSAFGFVFLCAVVMVIAHALATFLAAIRTRVAARVRPSRQQNDRFTLPTY